MSFRVGQRVRVVNRSCPYYGCETTVLSELKHVRALSYNGRAVWVWGHHVDLPPSRETTKRVWLRPFDLAPIDDPPELGSWSELSDIWVPDGVAS